MESPSTISASALHTAAPIPAITLAAAEALGVLLEDADEALEQVSAFAAGDDPSGIGVSLGGVVISDVIGASSELKILKPVIVLDLVDVVNVLVGSELASQMLLHDEAMLENIEAVSGELNVAVAANSPVDDSVAALAAAMAASRSV